MLSNSQVTHSNEENKVAAIDVLVWENILSFIPAHERDHLQRTLIFCCKAFRKAKNPNAYLFNKEAYFAMQKVRDFFRTENVTVTVLRKLRLPNNDVAQYSLAFYEEGDERKKYTQQLSQTVLDLVEISEIAKIIIGYPISYLHAEEMIAYYKAQLSRLDNPYFILIVDKRSSLYEQLCALQKNEKDCFNLLGLIDPVPEKCERYGDKILRQVLTFIGNLQIEKKKSPYDLRSLFFKETVYRPNNVYQQRLLLNFVKDNFNHYRFEFIDKHLELIEDPNEFHNCYHNDWVPIAINEMRKLLEACHSLEKHRAEECLLLIESFFNNFRNHLFDQMLLNFKRQFWKKVTTQAAITTKKKFNDILNAYASSIDFYREWKEYRKRYLAILPRLLSKIENLKIKATLNADVGGNYLWNGNDFESEMKDNLSNHNYYISGSAVRRSTLTLLEISKVVKLLEAEEKLLETLDQFFELTKDRNNAFLRQLNTALVKFLLAIDTTPNVIVDKSWPKPVYDYQRIHLVKRNAFIALLNAACTVLLDKTDNPAKSKNLYRAIERFDSAFAMVQHHRRLEKVQVALHVALVVLFAAFLATMIAAAVLAGAYVLAGGIVFAALFLIPVASLASVLVYEGVNNKALLSKKDNDEAIDRTRLTKSLRQLPINTSTLFKHGTQNTFSQSGSQMLESLLRSSRPLMTNGG